MQVTILLLCLFSVSEISAQEKEIMYRQADGKLMTTSQYVKMKNDFSKKMLESGKKGEVKEVIKDSITQKTIYKNFKLFFLETKSERIDSFVGNKFPSQKLQTLDSRKISFSQLVGKPTFVTFWFTSCAPCIKELPALLDLKNKYKGKVNFIAITFNNKQDVEAFLKMRKFDYTHIVDANDFIKEIGLTTYPRNAFIDKTGTVRAIKYSIPSSKKYQKKEVFDTSEFEKILNGLL
jgi:thiol-disulfide isomerase/thioredoxin